MDSRLAIRTGIWYAVMFIFRIAAVIFLINYLSENSIFYDNVSIDWVLILAIVSGTITVVAYVFFVLNLIKLVDKFIKEVVKK